MQGYSLTFWPKITLIFEGEIFLAKIGSILSRSILGKNAKAIALLFGQNLPFLMVIFLGKNLAHFCPAECWIKIQGCSLTFWPKITQI